VSRAQQSRQSDDLVILRLVRMRAGGLTTVQIAKRTGLSDGYVRSATNKVRAADIAESGEPDAAAGYW